MKRNKVKINKVKINKVALILDHNKNWFSYELNKRNDFEQNLKTKVIEMDKNISYDLKENLVKTNKKNSKFIENNIISNFINKTDENPIKNFIILERKFFYESLNRKIIQRLNYLIKVLLVSNHKLISINDLKNIKKSKLAKSLKNAKLYNSFLYLNLNYSSYQNGFSGIEKEKSDKILMKYNKEILNYNSNEWFLEKIWIIIFNEINVRTQKNRSKIEESKINKVNFK